MKRVQIFYFIFLIGFVFNNNLTFSQTSDTIPNETPCQAILIEDNCQSIMKIKKDFISKNLKLSENDNKNFWPIYNEYLKQEALIYDKYKFELEKKNIKSQHGRVIPSASSDEQIVFYLDMYYQTREATTILEQKLYLDLKKILEPRTLIYFLDLERSFKSRVREKAQGACPRSNK